MSEEKDSGWYQAPLLLRLLIVVGIPYFVGRYQMDEAPAEVSDHFYAIGLGIGRVLRFPLEMLGLVN